MLTVIGCGNPNRSDDGVGVVVARRVAEHLERNPNPAVRVFDAGTGGMEVMFQARGSRQLVLVDACSSGSEPGAVFEVPGSEFDSEPPGGFTLHDFRWDHALFAGRRIFGDDFPEETLVFLIEAGSLELGLELTAAVAEAATTVTARLCALVDGYRAPGEHEVVLESGNLYLDGELFDELFAGVHGLVLVRDGAELAILPVRLQGAGGLLVKQRNARGDRVVHAQEFLREQSLEPAGRRTLRARWDAQRGALVAPWPCA